MQSTRQTKQRHTILHLIQHAEGPLTAEQIHIRANAIQPNLGLATIYRTLKMMVAAGFVTAVNFPAEETHYEITEPDRPHHHHFRCLDCDQWFRLEQCLFPLPDGTILPEGYVIEAHYLTLYGRCPTCAAKATGS